MRLPLVLAFTALTFLSWGAYGPVLHRGSEALHHDTLRAFVGVGLAYFLIAVLLPLALLRKLREGGRWTIRGSVFSFLAGAVGAIGALGVILALVYGGKPVYVMPLVFGFAPVVNTLVTATLSGTFNQIRPIFVAGILAAAVGAAGVLYFKPAPAAASAKVSSQPSSVTEHQDEEDVSGESHDGQVEEDANASAAGVQASASADAEPVAEPTQSATGDFARVVISIALAALCWGSYGPLLHIGQARMAGSRLRPFICVGVAYFIIAVAAPLVIIAMDGGFGAVTQNWTTAGLFWSFMAGAAGAIGALGVVLAFNAGGKPYYVMPLIFGFAPVVNTSISLTLSGAWGLVAWPFWLCLATVIVGAVTVLITAPRAKPKPSLV
ncbi:MAG: hypothetical protein KatS3mg111_4346 [Pirellulaceae bacterium]|nr:MAG: hypothetical protein KatS3mg111_4346 [Pirellulaceae bacterium]